MRCVARRLAAAARAEAPGAQHLLSDRAWSVAASAFSRECCALMGAAAESPFAVAVDAGAAALPTLLKMTTVMAAKGQPWEGLEQLPLEVELPPRFAFHSVFACPVARDQSTPDNPPMILPCGCAAMRRRCAARAPWLTQHRPQPRALQAVHPEACARKRARIQVPVLPGAHLRSAQLFRSSPGSPGVCAAQIEVAVSQCKEIKF